VKACVPAPTSTGAAKPVLADGIAIAMTSSAEEGGYQGRARTAGPLPAPDGRTASVRFSVNPALVPRRLTGPSLLSDR
jgi:hypothetical protein